MALVDEIREMEKGGGGGQQQGQALGQQLDRPSLLQEFVDSNGTNGLNADYVNKALSFDGGFGAFNGGYIPGDDGRIYMRNYQAEAERLRRLTKPIVTPEDYVSKMLAREGYDMPEVETDYAKRLADLRGENEQAEATYQQASGNTAWSGILKLIGVGAQQAQMAQAGVIPTAEQARTLAEQSVEYGKTVAAGRGDVDVDTADRRRRELQADLQTMETTDRYIDDLTRIGLGNHDRLIEATTAAMEAAQTRGDRSSAREYQRLIDLYNEQKLSFEQAADAKGWFEEWDAAHPGGGEDAYQEAVRENEEAYQAWANGSTGGYVPMERSEARARVAEEYREELRDGVDKGYGIGQEMLAQYRESHNGDDPTDIEAAIDWYLQTDEIRAEIDRVVDGMHLDIEGTAVHGGITDEERQRLAQARYKAAAILDHAKQLRFADVPEREDFTTGADRGREQFQDDRKAHTAYLSDEDENDPNAGTYIPSDEDWRRYVQEREDLADEAEAAGYTGDELYDYVRLGLDQWLRDWRADAANASRWDTRYSGDIAEPDDRWTDEEKNVYYYLYSSDPDRAREYALTVRQQYNTEEEAERRRSTQEYSTRNFATGALSTLGAIPGHLFGGLYDYAKMAAERSYRGGIYDSQYTGISKWADDVTGSISQKLNEYGTIPQDSFFGKYMGLGGKGIGDLYSVFYSMAESAASIALGGDSASLVMFFGSAAASTTRDMLNRGVDPEKALRTGFAAGCAEAMFERLSIENLLNEDTLVDFFKKGVLRIVLKQGGVEASEEFFTEISNEFMDRWINGGKSEYASRIYALQVQGMSYEDAKKQAGREVLHKIWDASLSGFLSGLGMSAGHYMRYSVPAHARTYEGDVKPLTAAASLTERGSLANRYGAQVEKQMGRRGSVSQFQAEKLEALVNDQYKPSSITEGIRHVMNTARKTKAAETAEAKPAEQKITGAQRRQEESGAVETVRGMADFASGKTDSLPAGASEMTREQAESEIVTLAKNLGMEDGDASESADDYLKRAVDRVQSFATVMEQSVKVEEENEQNRRKAMGEAVDRSFTGLSEEEREKIVSGFDYDSEAADPGDYLKGMYMARLMGENGATLKQAQAVMEAMGDMFSTAGISGEQFRTAWKIGHAHSGSDYASIGDFAAQYPAPDSVTEIFNMDEGMDLYDFTVGFRAAYDMGRSGVSEAHVTEDTAPYLTEQQRKAAYELGQEAADKKAQKRSDKIDEIRRTGKLERKKGTVRGVGVTIAELRKKFNDPQRISYRFLSRFAELTGVDIVLYESETDEHGNFAATQGEFRWKDDTIYIDINSGLFSSGDVNELGKYTMLRTFSHEFTHFIEKWNAKGYNEFRKFVFSTMKKQGVNVNDLIETKMGELNMSEDEYEQASREVVADSMMDILPDSRLVQNLAEEHPNIFKTLLRKLKQFVGRLKQYYKGISTKIPEAELLKKSGAYLDDIVRMWDDIAKTAVENYQSANGQERTEPETRRAGMDFFRNVEETGEEAPNLRQMAAKNNRTVGRDRFPANDFTSQAENGPELRGMAQQAPAASRDRFPANDFTSQAEAGPDLKSMVPRAESAPSETQETQAAKGEAETPAATETPAQEESAPQDTQEGARLRAALIASDSVEVNGFRYAIFGMKNTTLNLREGGVSTGTEYWGTIARVSSGPVPVSDARTLFNRSFDSREEAVDYMVSVAENNHLLEEAKTDGTEETAEAAAAPVQGQAGDRSNGRGTVSVSPELQTGDVQRDAAGRQSDSVPSEEGDGAGRHGDRSDAGRAGRVRSKGTGESRVQSGRGGDAVSEQEAAPTEEEQQRQTEELHEETQHQVEEKSTEHAGGNNFTIGESLNLPNGTKARFRANVEAIRLVRQLEEERRNATPEEQAILSKFVGWGGIADAFPDGSGKIKDGWQKEAEELRGLLNDEEYRAAADSTANAHYTSIEVIKAMYDGLRQLGFKGGRMLEPSCGVGHFAGAMPADMTSTVKSWTMVELDNITGLIAKHLYPQNDVRIEGFEKAIIPDGFMDVAIGNVPFGDYPIIDRAYPKEVTAAIHNYFFAKTLDKVRPGGIVMFITSSFTLNSQNQAVRKYIAKRADLLGAIRLPNTAFKGNAGTSVVTDILILKKRADGTAYAGQPFINAERDWRLGGVYYNEYFRQHPEMILGVEEAENNRGMYGRGEYTVNPHASEDAGTLSDQIQAAFATMDGQMDYTQQATPEKTNYKVQRAEKTVKNKGFVQKDGKLYRNTDGKLQEVEADEKTAKRITGMLGIRDLARELLNAQQQGVDAKHIKDLRKRLNKAYDEFVKVNGYLNSPANKQAFADDPDRYSLCALENYKREKREIVNSKGKTVNKYVETATKADIFTENTVQPNRTVTHSDSVADGLIVSRNTTGGVDVDLISRLTGKTAEEVTRELVDSELAFKNRDGQLEPAEVYLSGNVRAKLRDAQGMVGIDKDYQHNVDALKLIVPKDIPHEQIFVQPGTPWIPDSVYSDFAAYMLGGNNYRYYGGPDIAIHRSNVTGTFTIDLNNASLKKRYQNTQSWGTPKRSFLNLLDALMNSRSVTVTYKDPEGHTIVDKVATDAANEMMEKITKEFQEWLWRDEERTKDLEYLYNETFNNLVTPKYDGSTLQVNGLRAGYELRPHQAAAVQRVISSGGNTLLAHRVGAGKTMEMAASAMKLKELGIVQKPMFAVPKSLVAQWGNEFNSYFPAAKLLVAEESDFTPANRKTFANRIATGNYDAIIVSYEQFEKIPVSNSFAASFYQEQIDEIVRQINEAKEERGQKSMSVKDLVKTRKRLEAKLAKLTAKEKDTDAIEFEQLGIDSIFIDEAHNFKNLFYTTSMNNVSGLGNKDGSQRAFDLYTKVRYLQRLNGGRGIVFATATPVMNSMSEMYIMQKYLQPDLLDQLGLSTFDAWAKQFGEVVNGVEIKPSGQGYRIKQSFSRFKNMNELQLLFRDFSDVLTQVPGLKIPKMKGGAVKIVECESGEFQKEYMKKLEERANNIKNVDPSEDNMLKITSDGRKISYTQRMIDPSLPYEEGCKIYRCAENVVQEYKASSDIRGTQLIFLDMATPKGKSNSEKASSVEDTEMDAESAQLYTDLKRRLVKLGIPANEVAFIHDADTDAKKEKLFDDVNEGRVRVLIGSTGKMGVGMNAQKRIVAIHHLDAPWRPGDVEQRDGRAFRQKNMNEEVSKYVYVTTGSFDARLWDIIDRKSSFINSIMNGENVGRDVEDTGEVTLSAAEVKALASGSPLILEQVQLETDIKKLQNLYMAYRARVADAIEKSREARKAKGEAETRAANMRRDIKRRTEDSTDEKFRIKIGNGTYTDKREAGKVLMAHATAKATDEKYTKIGTFAGFDISVIQTKEGIIGLLQGDSAYKFNTYPDNTTLMITNMQKLLNNLDVAAKAAEEYANQKDQEAKELDNIATSPFDRQEELDKKRARYNEVMEILNPKEEQKLDSMEESDEDEDNVEYSLRNKRIPTRRELEAKGNIQVVDIRSNSEGRFRQQREDIRSSQFVKELIENPVLNRDTGEMLFVLPRSITHSFSNRGGEQLQMVRNLRAILENAVLTHREDSRTADNDHTTGVYKFFAAVQTDEGVMPVKITVKEYFLEGQSLPASVSRYLQNNPDTDTYASMYDGKVLVVEGIEKETPGSVRATTDARSAGDTYPEVSIISIRELLSLVKGEDLKYLPQTEPNGAVDNGDEDYVEYSRRVTDPKTLKFLNDQLEKGEVVHTYKTFLEIVNEDGSVSLYPPMATVQRDENGKKKMANAMAVGEWEESIGNPNSRNIQVKTKNGQPVINPKTGNPVWQFKLEKDAGSTVPAAYNPYQHSSDLVLNDQFSAAYQRPNLVTYECVIPKSELTSGYHYRETNAQGQIVEAKDAVGLHEWKTGDVAGKLKNSKRMVYLSRWLMPVRRLDNNEVARMYKEILDKESTPISVPFNVVPPGLQESLERIGVPIDYRGNGNYQKQSRDNPAKYPMGTPIYTGEVENSTRRQTFSDREILEMATDSLDVGTLTPAEQTALDIFKKSLDALRQAQEKRASLGQQYRDEQFTKGGSRAEAEKIHAQMKVLDQSIPQMETRLLELQNKDALKKILVKAREAVETIEKEEGKQKLRQYRERRNESAAVRKYRARVQADVKTLRNWLVNPSSKDIRQHVPAELQKTVADFLESINLMSKTFLNSSGAETTKADERYLKSMQRLRDAIKKNVDSKGLYSGYADLPEDFMEIFDGLIRKVQDHIDQHTGTFVVNQMTGGELRELSNTLRTLRQYISNMNQFHNNAMFKHAYDAGEETIEHLSELQKSKKGSRAYKFMRFDYMRPSYVFEHFGKGGQSIEHEFREGQAQQAFLANTIINFAKETYSGREVKAWGDESRSFELENGETVTLPITHIMSLYCLTKRKQAQTHIYGDGIRVANYKEGRKVQLDEGHLVTQADVENITGALTDRQKQVADALQHFMSTVTSGWGNYVSMIRFGVEQFTEENYFPINSDGRYLSETADESPDNAGLYALLNSSFTKELRENAKNRIILYNVFDVFANHTASMAQYRSFALPVLDALKWFNYQNDNTSVRTKLASAFGAKEDERAGSGSKGYAEQFVINLLKSYNGTSAQGDPYDSMGLKGLHKFNRAQIAYNTRVVIQQPMAVTRAAMILSPAKLAEGLGMSATHLRKLAAEMEEHSGIAAWKALGFYDTNISRGLTELIKQNQSWDEKFVEFGTKGAELADRFTWAAMWYAAKQSVDRSRYETDAEYMKAVTDLFEEVIYKTQVVDSVLTKSEFLRAKGFFPRMLGSFMSEPMTTVSMLTDAYYKYTDDLQRGMSRGQAWRRNGKNIAKTVAVYSIGQILLAAMQAVIDGWRDDDEYDVENPFKNFLMKYLNAFKSNVIEEELPFGKIPLVSEIYDGLKGLLDYTGLFDQLGLDLYGNGLSNGWAQYAKYLQKGFEISWDLINGNQTNYTAYGAAYNLLRGTSGMVGLPIATLMREVVDLWNNTAGWYAPDKRLVSYQRSTDRKYLEHVRPAGISLKTYERILTDADAAGDGLGSTSQDELGQYLIDLINAGEITQAQAQAIWDSRGWKSSFATWRDESAKKAAAAAEHSRRIAATGLTEERYETIMTAANTDGKGNSPNQGELGTYLLAGIRSGTLSDTAAQGIWNTMGWKTSFADWQRKNT